MENKQRQQAKVYEFKPRKNPRLKTVDYVSPEKRELQRKRKQVGVERRNFYVGVAVFLVVVALLTLFKLV